MNSKKLIPRVTHSQDRNCFQVVVEDGSAASRILATGYKREDEALKDYRLASLIASFIEIKNQNRSS